MNELVVLTLTKLSLGLNWNEEYTLIPSQATWTHFVYLNADNNLDSAGVEDLNEMIANPSTDDDLNIVVYIDRSARQKNDYYHFLYILSSMYLFLLLSTKCVIDSIFF